MSNQKYLDEFEEILKTWTETEIGRKSFLASVPILLASCAATGGDKGRYREGDNKGQETKMTVQDEEKLTAEVLPEMRKDYPPINDSELQSYISSLGEKIVRTNNLDGKPYKYNFTVVGVNYVNAFALPAGTVYVTAPLIAMAETESELAGVVGHEVGHIQARHTAERMEAEKKEQGKLIMLAGGGGILGGLLGLGAGIAICPPKDNACLAKAAGAGALAGAAGGFLIHKYKFMANSRENEMEADRIGFKTSYNAGFSKAHIGKFYEKLLNMEKEAKKGSNPMLASLSDAFSTHPPSQERVNQMNQMVAEAKNNNGIVSSVEFDRAKKLSQDWIAANRKS
ncbi:MAG: M48 family metalloprotease [Leptospiraceae bacterium]|nr:M48 family metalloprotease [Leptospiraceae bacterium]